MRIQNTLCALLLLTLVGCAAPKQSLYQWGDYENQVYSLYNDSGKAPIEAQIETLEADYQKARSTNKAVPPGFHAHLGYLYFQAGKGDQAILAFRTEKALFPESTVYMDRILAKAKK
ncbi:MAG: hypothetical protein RLZ00_129 [Pseudomonadota bacterium]|jgi:hypothetical protein